MRAPARAISPPLDALRARRREEVSAERMMMRDYRHFPVAFLYAAPSERAYYYHYASYIVDAPMTTGVVRDRDIEIKASDFLPR